MKLKRRKSQQRPSNTGRLERRLPALMRTSLAFEALEDRRMLAVVWSGAGDGTSWFQTANWVNNVVPTQADDAVIGDVAGTPTISISGYASVKSLSSHESLAISNGYQLTMYGSSTFDSNLTVNPGAALTISGPGSGLTVSGTFNVINGASLYALNGASLTVSSLTTCSGYGGTSTLQAFGANSVLSFPNLASITADNSAYGSALQVQALNGGTVNMPALTSITGGKVQLKADGTNSLLNASALTQFTKSSDSYNKHSSLQATNGATLSIGSSLTSFDLTDLTVDGNSTFPVSQITSLTNGQITVSGGTVSFSNLTNINKDSVFVSGGATTSFLGVTTFIGTLGPSNLQATDAGSVLALPNLASITEDTSQFSSNVKVLAGSGGRVNLSGLAQITGGPVLLESDGAGSLLDVSAVTTFSAFAAGYFSNRSLLQATYGATLSLNTALTNLNNVSISVDGSATFPFSQFTALTNAPITVSGGTVAFSNLANINGADVTVNSGATGQFPAVLGYSGGPNISNFLLASGSGSLLSMPYLATIMEDTSGQKARIRAEAGGHLSLPALTQIGGGPVQLVSDGLGSSLDVSAMTTFNAGAYTSRSSIEVTTSGAILLNAALTTLNYVDVKLHGNATFPFGQFTSITNGTITVSALTVTLGNLSNINYDSVMVSGGATATFPSVATFSGPNNSGGMLQASGAGSKLLFPSINTITGSTVTNNTLIQIQALSGGLMDLSALTAISGGPVQLQSQGSGGLLKVPALTTFSASGGYVSRSGISATSSGTISLSPSLTALNYIDLTIDGTAILPVGQFTGLKNCVITVSSGNLTFPLLANVDGSSIMVNGGAVAEMRHVTHYTGMVGALSTLQASDAGSQLSLPNISSISENTTNNPLLQIQALSGGSIIFESLNQIDGGPVVLKSDGASSTLDVSALTSFKGMSGFTSYSTLQATNGGTLTRPALKQLEGVAVTVDTGGTFSLASDQSYVGVGSASLPFTGGTFTNQGTINLPDNSTVNIHGALNINGLGILTLTPLATLQVKGNLVGTTQNVDAFIPRGTVVLTSATGTTVAPQLLEAMSQDLGAVQTAFDNNFAYGTLKLANSTYAKLVDQSDNYIGSGNEALYVNELVVPSTATLDLNGLHLYVRGSLVPNPLSIVNGTITQLAAGGNIQFGEPTHGTLSPSGQITNWTFFGRKDEAVTVLLNPGGTGTSPPLSPFLNYGQVTLLDSSNSVLAGPGSSSGAIVSLAGVNLPADGTYTIQVQAAPSQPSSTGNYVVSVYDATPVARTLELNQSYNSSVPNSYSVDKWSFVASAGVQVQLSILNSSYGSIQFDLDGPGGYHAFTNLSSNSGLITLPSTGSYVLTAHSGGTMGGSYAFELNSTTITTISLGSTYSGTLAGSAQAQVFKVSVPANQSLKVLLDDSTSADINELYVKRGAPPTRNSFDYRYSGSGSADQQILVPTAAAGDWYILVYSSSVASPSNFTLGTIGAQVKLDEVFPTRSAAGSTSQLVLHGSGFDNSTVVRLVASNNVTTYPAASVSFDTFTQLTATFNLTGVPQGVYSVEVERSGGATDRLSGIFTVAASGQTHFENKLILPKAIGFHVFETLYVEYSNTGSVAMPAPVLVLQAVSPPPPAVPDVPRLTLDPKLQVSGIWTSATPEGYSSEIQILASGKIPGMLQPGESVTVPVYYAGMEQPWSFRTTINFQLSSYDQNASGTIDWSSVQASLQPPNVSADAWSVIFGNFTTQVGNTWASYVQMLDNEAAYLGHLGESVTNVVQLWALAIAQANANPLMLMPTLANVTDLQLASPGQVSLNFSRSFSESIASRYRTDRLGYGWYDNWDYSLSVAGDGTVTVTVPGGFQRTFQPDSRNSNYFTEVGDHGILRVVGGGKFTLTETNGQVESFNADGTLDYIQDIIGNRITCGYASGLLTSLTSSTGQFLSLTYYSGTSLIHTVGSSDGRTVTYNYASNQLTSVQGYDSLVTSYGYDSSGLAAKLHALTTITYPDGTHAFFTYNSAGHLLGTSQDGGVDSLIYTYDLGQETVTDANSHASHYFFNELGLLVKTVDPLGNASFFTYDANFNRTSVTDPTGLLQTYTYDSKGNRLSSTDPLGRTTQFTYASNNLLSQVTDARGAVTSFIHDSHGNTTAIQYPDHTVRTATYDALGDPLTLVNQNREVTTYTYNSVGQVKTQLLADGSLITFYYDSRANLDHAVDASGTTYLTYDSGDRLTEITYPGGRFLTYTYVNGRRTQMVDQSGFMVNYHYNAVGQLWYLTDVSLATIVTYTYNSLGQLSRQDLGNGTYTTYLYDAVGRIEHLVNYSPTAVITSRFDYTYDSRGNVTNMVTLDGIWSYDYDATGQLVHAGFNSTNPDIVNQDLAYTYDAAGNRVQTIINGATTAYSSNGMNQYTTVGTASYNYDLAGNLISKTDGGGTTTFTYNSLGRQVGMSSASDSWTFGYNALGYLANTTHNGAVTKNLVDPTGLGNLWGQYDGSGTLIAHYTQGLGLVSQVTTAGANYFQFDGLGSTVGLTNSTGSLLNTYSYMPFGGSLKTTGSAPNPFTYVGQFGVASTGNGLYDMRARDYDPVTGRFLSHDPIGFNSGETNLYRYVANSPTTGTDPSGRNRQVMGELLIHGYLLVDDPDHGGKVELHFGLRSGEEYLIVPEQSTSLSVSYSTIHSSPEDDRALIAIWGQLESDRKNVTGFLGYNILWNCWSPVIMFARYGAAKSPPPPNILDVVGGSIRNAIESVLSWDPNDKFGPTGFGSQHFVAASVPLGYHIDFENASTATAPAQQVVVTDVLNSNLDLASFELAQIGFGDTTLIIPPGSQSYETTVPMTYNGESFSVVIHAALDYNTRTVTWRFWSLNPDTELPPSVLTGFLPPEDTTGRGKGFLEYSIKPLPGLPTDTVIRNVAQIKFDSNPWISTDQVNPHDPSQGIDPVKQAMNTLDAVAPASSVAALATTISALGFTVNWAGTDDTGGSGVAMYNIWMSIDGATYTEWKVGTTDTSGVYTSLPGTHTCAFYSQAIDNVANVEQAHSVADTTATVHGPAALNFTASSSTDLTLRLFNSNYEIIDTSSTTVLASQAAVITTAINVIGSSGNDIVRLDASIFGTTLPISVTGGGGADEVEVKNQADSANTNYTVAAGSLAIGATNVSISAVANLAIDTGSGSDSVTILSTPGPTVVTTGGASQTVNIGGSVHPISDVSGTLQINGNATSLHIDDSANSTPAVAYTLQAQSLTTALADLVFSGLSDLLLTTGNQSDDVINILSTAAAATVTANPAPAAAGQAINVGDGTHSLDGIAGALTINANSGNVSFNDSANASVHTYTLSGNTFTRSGTPTIGAITLNSVSGLNFTPSSVADWIYVNGQNATTTTISGKASDSIVVQSVGTGKIVNVNVNGTGSGTVTVGNTGNMLNGILGAVNITGAAGSTAQVVIKDSSYATGTTYNFTNPASGYTNLTRNGLSGNIKYSNINNVSLTMGSGGDTVNLGTPSAPIALNSASLAIQDNQGGGGTFNINATGNGNLTLGLANTNGSYNYVNLQSIPLGNLALNGAEGNDYFTLGSATVGFDLTRIQTLTINGAEGPNYINVYYHLATGYTLEDDHAGHIYYKQGTTILRTINYSSIDTVNLTPV